MDTMSVGNEQYQPGCTAKRYDKYTTEESKGT